MQNILEKKVDRLNYLKGLIRLSVCNDDISIEEKQFYLEAAANMELDEGDMAELDKCWQSSGDFPVTFSSKKVSLFFLQEAVQLCEIDGNYDEIEKREILKVGNELGLSTGEIRKIEAWVREGMEWKKRGEQLLDELAEGGI